MSEHLNYKSALLYLYKLVAMADGDRSKQEFDLMYDVMRKYEDITREDWNTYIMSDFGDTEHEFRQAIGVLKRCNRDKQVRAVAWMKKVMMADGEMKPEEKVVVDRIMNELEIKEGEVKATEKALPVM
jgi:uncharacterized tellurite resistance protein B-like protein